MRILASASSRKSKGKDGICDSSLYRFCMMPFGLQGAPMTFQRMMDQLLRGLEGFAAWMTLSSTVIRGRSIYSILRCLTDSETGLTAKSRKCQFAMKTVYLPGPCCREWCYQARAFQSWSNVVSSPPNREASVSVCRSCGILSKVHT